MLPCDCDSSPRGPGMSTQVRSAKCTALRLCRSCADDSSDHPTLFPRRLDAVLYKTPLTSLHTVSRWDAKARAGPRQQQHLPTRLQTTSNVVRDAVVRRCRHTYPLMQGARHVGSRGDVEAESTAALSCVPHPPGNDACCVNRLHLALYYCCHFHHCQSSFIIGLTSLHLRPRSRWNPMMTIGVPRSP